MRRLIAALLLLAGTAYGQARHGPCKMDGSDCGTGGGSGTVTSVGNGTISGLFVATWATPTVTPKLSLAMAAAAANTGLYGPTTGADAAPTFRALVSADLGSYALNPAFNTIVSMPSTNVSAAAFRRSGVSATANIVEFQTSANALLSGVKADGTFYGSSLASIIGTNLGLAATAPAATTGASQAGKAISITASPAVASTDTAGAAAGGSITYATGDAARNASGNAAGGDHVFTTGAGVGTGGAGQVVVPAGTGNRPSLVFSGSSGTGFSGTATLYAWSGGTLLGYWGTTTGLMSAYGFAWNAVGSSDDSYLTRRAAQSLQWGKPAASPAAYTITGNSSRGGTDTDVAGGAVNYSGGLGTGLAAGGNFGVQTGTPTTAGTTQNISTTRIYEVAAPKALTSGAGAVNFLDITLPTDDSAVGYEVHYTFTFSDGTNASVHKGIAIGAAYRATGGTVTATAPTEASETNHNTSGGNATDTFGVTVGTGKITLTVTATKGSGVSGTITRSEMSYSVWLEGRHSSVIPL